MNKENNEAKREMKINEFISALLAQDDVSGITIIAPGQPVVTIGIMEGQKKGEHQNGNN